MNLLEWSRGEAVRGSLEETVEVSTRRHLRLFCKDFLSLFILFVCYGTK